nr:hypothetical protein [Tanacetum cinerariifolium]
MMSEDSSAVGTDNHPPMLEESDYESWKIRIERYIKGKTHGKLIWKSILNGPLAHPQITDPVPTGSPAGIIMQPRDKRDKEFTNAENLKEFCDIQASNILSQGVPRRIFNTLNQTRSAKEIWESLELLMKGSAQSHDDAMLATMKQIANLLSGFQKQFPPTNNQLSNTRNIGYRGNQNNGQGVNNKKKVIYYNCRGEGHVARQCKEPKQNGVVLDAEAEAFLADVECTVPLAEPLALTTTNMFQDEHLDSNDDSVHEDYTIPYDQYLATKESQDVPTEASPIPHTAAYMLQMLTDLTTQVKGHRKVNQEPALVNATLSAELDQCKVKLARLERNKVKLECDQVIVARNKRNAELEQETELFKTTLRNKEATIASLTSETKTVLSEKKTLEHKYLEEIPTLYDDHRLLQPDHAPVMVSDSHETLLETEVSRMKMSQKPGHVTPVDYTKLNALYDQFVPQKELSREQVYWLSASNIASQSSDIASQSSDPPKQYLTNVENRITHR